MLQCNITMYIHHVYTCNHLRFKTFNSLLQCNITMYIHHVHTCNLLRFKTNLIQPLSINRVYKEQSHLYLRATAGWTEPWRHNKHQWVHTHVTVGVWPSISSQSEYHLLARRVDYKQCLGRFTCCLFLEVCKVYLVWFLLLQKTV